MAVSGLFSPWRSWLVAIERYRQAALQTDKQAITQGAFGELYTLQGEAPEWKSVANLRHAYHFDEVPIGVRLLTCGIDVQKDRLYYVVRGWGAAFESWLIRHGEIHGETEHDLVWNELDTMLKTEIGERRIRLALIDSGYRPGDTWRRPDNQIYKFCRPRAGRVWPTKGHDTQDKPVRASKIDIKWNGKIIPRGLQLWHIDTDYFKTWLHARFEWPAGQAGGFHLAADTTDDYCKQVTAEAKVASEGGRAEWKPVRKQNHCFDCEVLNVAAAHILNVHVLRPPKEPKAEGAADLGGDTPPETGKPPPKPRPRVPRRNWVTQW